MGWKAALKGAPEFEGVCNFDRGQNGLVPVQVAAWEQFVFVNLDEKGAPLAEFLGGLVARVAPLNFASLQFFERRMYRWIVTGKCSSITISTAAITCRICTRR